MSASTPTTAFRGWTVVGAAFLILFFAYGLQFSFGVYLPVIVDEMGWSRSQLTLAYAVYIFGYSSLSGLSGQLTDRVGPRVVIGAGGLILGAGWMALSRSTELWHVYLTLGFAAIGMSATWVPANATVVRWFVRRRGLAVGVSSSGGSFGNFMVPPIASALTSAFGWQRSLLVLAGVGGVALFSCALLMSRDPESLGMLPDGDSPDPGPTDLDPGRSEDPSGESATLLSEGAPAHSLTPAEARRTSAYWLIMAVFGLTWLVVFVPFVHLVAYAEGLGIGTLTASFLISAIGVGGGIGRLGIGALSDRIGRRAVLLCTLSAQVCSFIGLAVSSSLWMLALSAIVFGFAYGGGVTTFPALIGDSFGRMHSGALVGQIFSVSGALAAVGPYLAAVAFEATGGYRAAFLFCALVNAVSLGLATRLPRAR